MYITNYFWSDDYWVSTFNLVIYVVFSL